MYNRIKEEHWHIFLKGKRQALKGWLNFRTLTLVLGCAFTSFYHPLESVEKPSALQNFPSVLISSAAEHKAMSPAALSKPSIQNTSVDAVYAGLDSKIAWQINYDLAISQSREERKPLFLFFTGSDWSQPSRDFRQEVLNSQSFNHRFASKFVFVEIDFPLSHALQPEQVERNQELKEKFHVEGFPTVVLLNQYLEPMGTTGCWSLGADKYCENLSQMVALAKELQNVIEGMKEESLDTQELKRLYEYAKVINRPQQAALLLQAGLQKEDNIYFLSEQYRELLEAGQMGSTLAQRIRSELLARDPHGQKGGQLYVAVLEFQTLTNDPKIEPKMAAAPLLTYLQEFGKGDSENEWRINMMLAQFFYAKNDRSSALKHAAKAYDLAPELIKGDIHKSIDEIKHSTL